MPDSKETLVLTNGQTVMVTAGGRNGQAVRELRVVLDGTLVRPAAYLAARAERPNLPPPTQPAYPG